MKIDNKILLLAAICILIFSNLKKESFLSNVQKCLIIPKPIDKKLCFTIPIKDIVDPPVNEIKNLVKELPNKVKTEVVNPAISGVEDRVNKTIKTVESRINKTIQTMMTKIIDLINKIKTEIMNLLNELKNRLSKVGEIMLKQIVKLLITVFRLLFSVIKPLMGVGKTLAVQMWKLVSTIAPWIQYVPFVMVASFTTPIFLPLVVISLILSIFTGPIIFLVMLVLMIAVPIILYMLLKDSIIELINTDWEKAATDILKEAPEIMEEVFKSIKGTISDSVKQLGKIQI